MFRFLELLRALLRRYGSLGGYLREVLVADGALPSRLRAAEPSACLPSRLRAAGLADRKMVGFAREPSAPPFCPPAYAGHLAFLPLFAVLLGR